MREIGGYFGLEKFIHREYYPNLIALNTGRNALIYLLKARKIRKIYLPYFLCDSVAKACEKYDFQYGYYRIERDFFPVFEKRLNDDEYLYIVNFYGQIGHEDIIVLKKRYCNIIIDNTQAFFQEPIEGVDTIYSCRKFFGVPDGAYLSTAVRLNEELATDVSKDRMEHLLGRFEGNASDYYSTFQQNDGAFHDTELRYMSALTHNLLGAINYESVKEKRNENYKVLADRLDQHNQLTLRSSDSPFCYPFLCENGMETKRRLAEEKIYIPTLWPNVLTLDGTLEKEYAENILPLPCDQRYGADEMKKIIRQLLRGTNA